MYNYKILMYDNGEDVENDDPYIANIKVPTKMSVGFRFNHWDRDYEWEVTEEDEHPTLYVDYDNENNSYIYKKLVAVQTSKLQYED